MKVSTGIREGDEIVHGGGRQARSPAGHPLGRPDTDPAGPVITHDMSNASPIGLLVSNPLDAKLLHHFLASMGHGVSVLTGAAEDLREIEGSGLILADETCAGRHAERLLQMKRTAEPFLLPILVLAGEKTDTSGWIKRGFDDVLRMPLVKAELMVRLETFLRLRAYSQRMQHENEERFRTTFNDAPSGIAHTVLDGRILMVNQRLCDMLGYGEEELLRLCLADFTYPNDLDATQKIYRSVIARKSKLPVIEKRCVRKDGTVFWGELRISVVRDDQGEPKHFISIISDISERKTLELKLTRVARARHLMAACNRILVHATEETELLSRMCEEAVRSGGYRMAWAGTIQHDPRKTVLAVASAELEADCAQTVFTSWSADNAFGSGEMGKAIRSGELMVIGNSGADTDMKPLHVDTAKRGFLSMMLLPLKVGGDQIGGLAVYSREIHAVSEDERALLNELAADISYGIETLRARRANAKVEAALRESERFARSTIDALVMNICVLDESGNILAVNRAWRDFAAANGNPQIDCVAEDCNYLDVCDRAAAGGSVEAVKVAAAIRAAIVGDDEIFSLEYPCHSPTEKGWFLVRISRFTGEGVPRVVVSHESVTQRRLMEDSVRESEARFRSLTNLSSDWYWEQDEQFRFVSFAGAMIQSVEFDGHALIGKTRWDMHKDSPSAFIGVTEKDWEAHRKLLEARLPFRDWQFSQLSSDGKIDFVSISGEPFYENAGKFKGYRGTGKYINEQKRGEQELLRARERMTFLLASTPAVIFACAAEPPYPISFISENLRSQFGYEPKEFLIEAPTWMHKAHPGDVPRIKAALPGAFETGQHVQEYRFKQKNGHYVWVQEEVRLVRGSGGKGDEIVGYMIDITEKKRFEEQLLHIAHYDTLTELPNRLLFYDRLKQAIAQAERSQWDVGVLFIDLDRFKILNDTLGHGTGDELLRQVSTRLNATVRIGDTVGRLGGDEFAVILAELNNPEDAHIVSQKIMQAFKQSFALNGREVFVTASIGITVFPADGQDPDTLIKNADTAMYRAKGQGRDNIQFYTPEMNGRALERLELENSLRRALERNEFVLHYQPKVNTRNGKLIGFEALLRWQRPEHGLVSPADFIPILEDTGLIVPVGEWVLSEACRQLRAWVAAGQKLVPIAVNLSARQLQSASLVENMRRIFNENGTDPALIELEITESALMHNTEEAVVLLKELKKTGLRISIDDFGTGYSSLAYLKRFPVDTLKIDRAFVRDVNVDQNDAAIARAIITMAHQLSLKVVAEGVETVEQLAFLVENGCDEAQGYLFSRPLPAEDLCNVPKVFLVTA